MVFVVELLAIVGFGTVTIVVILIAIDGMEKLKRRFDKRLRRVCPSCDCINNGFKVKNFGWRCRADYCPHCGMKLD